MKAYKIKATGEIFLTNYIDHFNGYVSKGNYKKVNEPLLKFNEIEEIEIEKEEFNNLKNTFKL